MNLKKYNKEKIFVTGVSGSGKTTFAIEYSNTFNIPYFSFDKNWSYSDTPYEEYYKIIKKYPDIFITDAIPYAMSDGELLFMEYYEQHKNNIKVVCLFCSDKTEYEKRVNVKYSKGGYNLPENLFSPYYDFYYVALKNAYSKFDMEYYDTFTNDFVNENQLYERIKWIKNIL